ncbi:MAG: 4Fe-4S dicluster domain-containing protein [Nitrospirae bacterium]|nr:4Fe-4S dicluster domain-containing protein [Nitrospirota bacterium]
MKALDLLAPETTRPQLEKDTLRIYEICDGCRRCINLCPSFNTLLDRIDVVDSDVGKLTEADRAKVADECYYCKLCYNHCPYTPPHHYALDFPRLMVAWKRQLAKERGVSWKHRLLAKTDLLGRMARWTAPLMNWTMRQRWLRPVLEGLTGIHRDRQVLSFQTETLDRWMTKRPPPARAGAARGKVALFAGCLVNYQATDVGKATVQVLEHNGIEVVWPEQRCCGMPSFDFGDMDAIKKAAEANVRAFKPWVDRGYDIVSPVPSCSLMLKREYPSLRPDDDTAQVAQHTYDVCEYLMRVKRAGHLSEAFVRKPGPVVYQIPCHLRDQNIGFKSKELMEAAGATVRVVERCTGHDGTWGVKTESFDLSMRIAAKAVRDVNEVPAELIATDCPLSGLQLDQAGAASRAGSRARHPIQIVRDAYGIAP